MAHKFSKLSGYAYIYFVGQELEFFGGKRRMEQFVKQRRFFKDFFSVVF